MTINAAPLHDPVTAPPVYHFYLDVSPDHAGKEIVRWHAGKMTILSHDGKTEIDQTSINHIQAEGAPLGLIDFSDGALLFRVPDLDGDGKPELASLNTGEILHTPLYTYKTPYDYPTVTFHKSGDPIHESYVMHPDVFSAVSNGRTLATAKTQRHDYTPVYTIRHDIDPSTPGAEVITIRDRILAPGARNVSVQSAEGQSLALGSDIPFTLGTTHNGMSRIAFNEAPDGFEIRFSAKSALGASEAQEFYIGYEGGHAQAHAPAGYVNATQSHVFDMGLTVEGVGPDPEYSGVSVFSLYLDE